MNLRILAVGVLLVFTNSAFGNDTFMHPSSWGVSEGDHYNTFLEDRIGSNPHVCYKDGEYYINSDECSEDYGYSFRMVNDVMYADRDCGYGGHCSHDTYQHSGIDYDTVIHKHGHDPEDNGKSMDLRQGRGVTSSLYHGSKDDIVASNYGEIKYVYNESGRNHGFGKTIILRHICAPGTSKMSEKCVQENGEWVIYTQYSHMSKIESDLSIGDTVCRDQKIGEIGGTGGWIHHLHFEFKTKGILKSPNGGKYSSYTPSDPTKEGYRDPYAFLGNVYVAGHHACGDSIERITPQQLCNNGSCNINYQTFSDGDNVGWYPQGSCGNAVKWFTLEQVNGVYNLGYLRNSSQVCICR